MNEIIQCNDKSHMYWQKFVTHNRKNAFHTLKMHRVVNYKFPYYKNNNAVM